MDDDLGQERDPSIFDRGDDGGSSENDPSLNAVRDAEESGVKPGFLGGSDWADGAAYKLNGDYHDKNGKKLKRNNNRKKDAMSGLASAEKGALNSKFSGFGAKEKESSGGGLFSGIGKGKKSKKGGKKGFAGKMKRTAPLLAIFSGLIGVVGMISSSQNILPIAIKEMIVEKLNSVGVSSTIASDDWLNTQLNQGVRVKKLGSDNAEKKFAFSSYQMRQFEKYGIKVIGGDDDDQITALLYEKDGQYIPVVGSTALEERSDNEIINAVAASADVENIGNPVSAEAALKDDDFKIPYTKASKAWRGGTSGWFDNIMSDITEIKLNTTRNRWAKYVTKSITGVSDEFKKIAKSVSTGKTSDKGMLKAEEIENEDGEVTGEEQIEKVPVEDEEGAVSGEVDTSNTSVTSSGAKTVEGISKVLNSKAVKAASAIGEYGCALLEGLVSIYTVVSAYQNMQFLNVISGFLESVDKVKAGDGGGSPINEYSTNLTTKTDTKDDNGNVVESRKGKTAVDSAGMAWLFGSGNKTNGNKVNNSDQSVRNVNFENIMSNISVLTSNIKLTTEVYAACGYVKAGLAAVDLATTIISFIPIAGQAIKGVQLTVKAGVKIAVKVAVQIALYAVIPIAAKNLANMMIKDVATDWLGEDLGNAITSGASKYLGGNGTSGGQSPGSMPVVTSYLDARDEVIADEARFQRATRSPFDITSRHTFLGSLAYAVIPIAYSGGGIMSNLSDMSNLVTSSAVAMLPTANAISKESVEASNGSCDLLGTTGAVGDAFCNPYIVTDTRTINTSPLAVNDIVHSLGNDSTVAATDVYANVGSENFDDNGKIKEGSDLAKYITFCGQRTSQYGIKDLTIAEQLTTNSVTKIMDYVPVVNDLSQIYEGLADEATFAWSNGRACVASDENDYWKDNKWYQRYAENERLVENMNPGYTSTVTAYLRDYYEKNPLDQSFEGTIARFTGMSKDQVEDTLALIDYYQFLNEYNPSERYAFGAPAVEMEKELRFDNDNDVAGESVWGILVDQISYADVRNRSFAV